MKIIKKMLLLLFMVGALSFSSCGEDNEPISCSEDEIENLLEQIEDVAYDFAQNPTEANCNAYKARMNDFIDYAENCEDVSQSEIDQLRSLLTELNCSDL